MKVDEEQRDVYRKNWQKYLRGDKDVFKFVPASGAASRMFKDLYAFLEAEYDLPTTDFEKTFFSHIRQFAFTAALDAKCMEQHGKNTSELCEEGRYKDVVSSLLSEQGLDYGNLPKGLLLFHGYAEGSRTAVEEHLHEGALYARRSDGMVKVHFTVSPEHQKLFEQLVESSKGAYESKLGVKFDVSYSIQDPSTDTPAVDMLNQPFRDEDGSLLFRPGGHGALIENLNRIDSDIIFIKNIDNVVPDRLKEEDAGYKKLLAGILVTFQQRAFEYIKRLEAGDVDSDTLAEILAFTEDELCITRSEVFENEQELSSFLRRKLNRPFRVCGMVKNQGEPGGGPFITVNSDGTASLQILESSQINRKDSRAVEAFQNGSHFNPVDLVCGVKNYEGEKFNLTKYVDPNTGFISHKSKNGKPLKALELPGLWNGAMSDWNTIFVDVPISTFNPVKTVNDLLRPEHQ